MAEDASGGKSFASLAIVIPAYKPDFFETALQSLAQQTDKKFRVYIGDDCSPFELEKIVKKFEGVLQINYTRFSTNLGSHDLVGQWSRCVDLIENEEWLWLFSDDDIAEETCVQSFREAIERTSGQFDAYRFNTVVIDSDGEFKSEAEPSPEIENPMSLAYNLLLWKRGNSMPDHIFKISRYKSLGGFINFPFAQASDWASSVEFSYPNGLYTISGPKVRWRLSGKNVSSVNISKKTEMILAHLKFLNWILNRFSAEDATRFNIEQTDIYKAAYYNLSAVLINHYRGVPFGSISMISARIAQIFSIKRNTALMLCAKVNQQILRAKSRTYLRKALLPVLPMLKPLRRGRI